MSIRKVYYQLQGEGPLPFWEDRRWKGLCFEAALHLQRRCHLAGHRLTLVHGMYAAGPHAWCEGTRYAYDPASNIITLKEQYYALVDARPLRRYSLRAALRAGIKAGTYGPW
jgi:hypothetical protein